jgi:hypothetical protein
MVIGRGWVDVPNQTISPVLNPIMISIRSEEAVVGFTS